MNFSDLKYQFLTMGFRFNNPKNLMDIIDKGIETKDLASKNLN